MTGQDVNITVTDTQAANIVAALRTEAAQEASLSRVAYPNGHLPVPKAAYKRSVYLSALADRIEEDIS